MKYDARLPELVDNICEYYSPLRRKEIVFAFDSTFVGNDYGVSSHDFHTIITRCFEKHGWIVHEKYIGKPWFHPVKQNLINGMFRGKGIYHILINEPNNPDLLVSIDSAMTVNGTNQKDKTGEKVRETEENRLEGRTDGSDAFDTLCIAVETEKSPVIAGGGGGGFC